jgi:parvulin-like peptidyl-prolyl isomerase
MIRFRTPFVLAFAALAVLLGGAALAACDGSGGGASDGVSPSPPADPVVVLVDGHPVRQSDVDAVRAEFRLGGSRDTEALAEKEAVRRELVRVEAERLDVAADAGEADARRAAMVEQLGGEEALAAALKQVPMTDEQLRSGLADGVLREALQDAKYEDLAATRSEAREYYDAHRASFREVASAHLWSIQVAAERIAESALGRLRSGRPFSEVARQFSTDPESKAAGGDLGTVALSSLPVPLRKAVEDTPAGEVSDPVEGPGGWYLLKATDVQPSRTAPFPEVEEQIVGELTRRERFDALEDWLDAAREAATVTRP